MLVADPNSDNLAFSDYYLFSGFLDKIDANKNVRLSLKVLIEPVYLFTASNIQLKQSIINSPDTVFINAEITNTSVISTYSYTLHS